MMHTCLTLVVVRSIENEYDQFHLSLLVSMLLHSQSSRREQSDSSDSVITSFPTLFQTNKQSVESLSGLDFSSYLGEAGRERS